jgi:hypothetical protein
MAVSSFSSDRERVGGDTMRITSREWQGPRWRDGLSFGVLAFGAMVVILSVLTGQHRTGVTRGPRVTFRERPEYLRFVAPAIPAPVPRTLAQGDPQARRRLTPLPLHETPVPMRDTGAAVAAAPEAAPSPPAAVPAAGLLASPLPVDRRLLVGPAAVASGVADPQVPNVNEGIALAIRALDDSVRRHARGWTVGDSTHRFGIAPCGIDVGKFCIPFRVGSMPNPSSSPAYSGLDRIMQQHAEVDAAIARARARSAKPGDGPPPRTEP